MSVGMMGPAGVETSGRSTERAARLAFLGVAALVVAASAAAAIAWSASMSAMGGTSMAWMPRPGQPWPLAAASFLGMWVVMTIAMMLPSLIPTLWRCREATTRTGGARPGPSAALVGLGYFSVWTAFGAAAFPLGAAVAMTEMGRPALAATVPLAAGLVVLIAGGYQFTAAKARHLACCREAPGRDGRLPDGGVAALRHGLRLGLHCVRCCAGLMVVLLVIGVTDLRVMVVVAAAVTAERLAPAGERVARAIGVVAVGSGVFLIARTAGLG